jgi:hypothetical protein
MQMEGFHRTPAEAKRAAVIDPPYPEPTITKS